MKMMKILLYMVFHGEYFRYAAQKLTYNTQESVSVSTLEPSGVAWPISSKTDVTRGSRQKHVMLHLSHGGCSKRISTLASRLSSSLRFLRSQLWCLKASTAICSTQSKISWWEQFKRVCCFCFSRQTCVSM